MRVWIIIAALVLLIAGCTAPGAQSGRQGNNSSAGGGTPSGPIPPGNGTPPSGGTPSGGQPSYGGNGTTVSLSECLSACDNASISSPDGVSLCKSLCYNKEAQDTRDVGKCQPIPGLWTNGDDRAVVYYDLCVIDVAGVTKDSSVCSRAKDEGDRYTCVQAASG